MTEEKQNDEKPKVVFEDPKAEENVPSTTDLANEKFLKDQVDFDRKIDPGSTRPLEEEGFVGVDPEYRNYASVSHQPFFAEGGVNEALETYALGEPEEDESAQDDESQPDVEPEENEDEVPDTGDDQTQTEESKSSDTPAPPAGEVKSPS